MSRRPKRKSGPEKAAVTGFSSTIPPSDKLDWILGLLLVLAVIIVYQPAWDAGFIWDDDAYVTGNKLLSASDGLRRIWFSFDSPSQYFPLTYTVLRLEYSLWGLNPAGYHWVNILLHAINALLVVRLLRKLNLPGAWLGAALWALHPVQVESVAWISELKNVLMCSFFLLALVAWIEFVEEDSKQRWNAYALALGFFALALFSKTTACTLPAALLLILWLKRRVISRQRLVQIIPFIAMGVGMGLITVWWERYHQGTRGESFAMGVVERILLASRAVWFYAGKLIWPVDLMFSYPRWTISASNPLAYVWLVATVGFGVAIYCARRYVGRNVVVAALFFASTLTPVLGFIMFYTFLYSFVADHYQYVASLGLIALVSAGIVRLTDSFQQKMPWLKATICVGLLLVLGTLSWRQAQAYRSDEVLWTHTLKKNPDSWMAHIILGNISVKNGNADQGILHYQKALLINPDYAEAYNNIGNALRQKGDVDEAIAHFQKTLQLKPDYAEAYNNLGNALLQKGNLDEAIAYYQSALQIKPDYAEAHFNLGNVLLQKGSADEAMAHYQKVLQINPDDAEVHYNLGNVQLQMGRADNAITHYKEALQIKPAYAEARNNLGAVLLQRGDLDEAIVQFQKVLQIKPDNLTAHVNLGKVLLRKGNEGEVIAHLQKALQIKPDYPELQNDLAWILATSSQASLRNGHQAVDLAQRANQLVGGQNLIILCTLAAAYAEAGQFSEAQQSAQKAIELARAAGQQGLAEEITIKLKLYTAGLPFHQESR